MSADIDFVRSESSQQPSENRSFSVVFNYQEDTKRIKAGTCIDRFDYSRNFSRFWVLDNDLWIGDADLGLKQHRCLYNKNSPDDPSGGYALLVVEPKFSVVYGGVICGSDEAAELAIQLWTQPDRTPEKGTVMLDPGVFIGYQFLSRQRYGIRYVGYSIPPKTLVSFVYGGLLGDDVIDPRED